MPKLLCTGDIHLGAGAEYGRVPGDRLQDQSDVLGRIAGIAVVHAVDGILVAGDVFEGPGVPPEQLELFARFVDTCRIAGIPILAITGNGKHDAAVRETNGLQIFDHIPGITVSATPDVYRFAGCLVATLPWVHPGKLAARLGRDVSRDEVNETVAQLLVDIAARGKDDCERVDADAPHILLGHWAVTGSALPNGLPVADLREPVIPIAELDQLGYSHIILGHIHRPQQVGERGFYVGSPMPLNFGETHTGHGVAIVHTDEDEPIDFYAAEYVEIRSRPLVTIDVDIAGEPDEFEPVLGLDDRDLDEAIVRVRYRATTAQHRRLEPQRLRAALLERGAHVVKIVPDIVRADRARVDGVDTEIGELAAFDQWAAMYDFPADTADRMRARLRDYLEAVPA